MNVFHDVCFYTLGWEEEIKGLLSTKMSCVDTSILFRQALVIALIVCCIQANRADIC